MALPASPPPLFPPKLVMAAVQRLRAWPVESQQTSRRNAMLACTSLTQRRMEHQEVADFLASFYGPSHASSVSHLPHHPLPQAAARG
ncbi:hypothetical protein [Nocardioides dilutus]